MKSNLIKPIKFIALLITLVISTYLIFVIIIGTFNIPKVSRKCIDYKLGSNGHNFTRLKEVNEIKEQLDILFLGSSHAYRGFDTRFYEPKKSFNLGSSSQTPMQTNILLKRYLDKLNPKLVIYEIYPATFNKRNISPASDLISNDINDIHSLKMVLEMNNFKLYNTYVYALIRDIFNINKSFVEPIKKRDDTYIKGGFVEKPLKFPQPEKVKNKIIIIDSSQFNYMKENIKLIKNNGSKIILVYAPVSSKLYKSFQNSDEIDSLIKQLNVGYYNLNKNYPFNDSIDFYDTHHLNQNGVKKLNTYMSDFIKNF